MSQSHLSLLMALAILPICLIAVYLLPFFADRYNIRHIPGPFLAKFSTLWLVRQSTRGRQSLAVRDAHAKYGPIVRIAPDRVSIATVDAMNTIYGHGNKVTKSNFYHAFQLIPPGNIFNTTDREVHARKRKIMSQAFSSKSLQDMEPHIHHLVGQLLNQFDHFMSSGNGAEGAEGNGWRNQGGILWLDILPWCHFTAFDVISKLAFGESFGMIETGQDGAPVPTENTIAAIQKVASTGGDWPELELTKVPAIFLVDKAGEVISTLGLLPPSIRVRIRSLLPWFSSRGQQMKHLTGVPFLAVSRRLKEIAEDKEQGDVHDDLLSKLQEAKDDMGQPLGFSELAAESQSMVFAGSDTISSSMAAMIYYLASNTHAQRSLHAELDAILGASTSIPAVQGNALKNLPYLDACIREGLRLLSTVPSGLPRAVPAGGLFVDGQHFVEGTVVSVPSSYLHHDATIWGADVEDFRPERWLDKETHEAREKAFHPFSLGPRSCIGRNLAMLEMGITIGSLFHRFELCLDDEKMKNGLVQKERFVSRPVKCCVGMKQRY